jgi:pimeloyl-ACP methyl ester carboxylesterase
MSHLGHIELGTPSRVALVFLHGFPAAAQQVMAVPDLGIFDRFRLIAIDRPGFGDSAPSSEGADVIARFRHLLAELGIDRFHLLAVSAGTATAFLVADCLRERVLSLTAISSLGPLDQRELYAPLPAMVRALFTLARHSPFLLAKMFEWRLRSSVPDYRLGYLEKILSPRDKAALRDPRIQDALHTSRRLAFKQGARAVAREARLMQQHWLIADWRFPFPVRLFHGSADHLVPPLHSEWLHARSPGSRLELVPDEGHYSLPIFRLPEILAEIQ